MDEQKLLKRRNKARQEGNEGALIATTTELAALYVAEERYGLAIVEYEAVAKMHKRQNNRLEYAKIHRGIGEAYSELKDIPKALKHQNIYLGIARELKDLVEEQRALATIGHIHLTSYLEPVTEPNVTDLHCAEDYFKKSLAVCQSLSGLSTGLVKVDMSARLYANMGLVQEALKNHEEACQLLKKSIYLCKTFDLHEQLVRGYMSFGSCLIKKEQFKDALQYFNLAVETAEKLKNNPQLLVGAFMNKADVLCRLGDFQAAKKMLMKAYKLTIPSAKERTAIEKSLRVVASMCNVEESLVATDSTDYYTLKLLYEKLGDAASELHLYDKALPYYDSMLANAIKANITGSDLAKCYYSLAETYKDSNKIEEALENFKRELELCEGELKEGLDTLSRIVDTMRDANYPVVEVEKYYLRAIDNCRKAKDRHEEGRMVKRFTDYLRRQGETTKLLHWDSVLSELNYECSDSDIESVHETLPPFWKEIDLEALSDDSDTPQPRRRTTFMVKRNVKGETQLHTACINGQLNVVQHLLDQGHPINVRDNCGWLPLHEAANAGYADIVKLLLSKGAAINDRGGTKCEGITPLHDAACNGNLDVVELLLNRGANPLVKTDKGETVAEFLQSWHGDQCLNAELERQYVSVMGRVSEALDKVGHKTSPERHLRNSALVIGLDSNSDEEEELPHPVDYINVMDNLRHKRPSKSPVKCKRSALVAAGADDWLDDDLKTAKKRRTRSPRKSPKNSPPILVPSPHKTPDDTYSSPGPSRVSKKQRKRQPTLRRFGLTVEEADSTVAKSPLPRTPSFDAVVIDPMLSIDVRIEQKLYRVPVLLSQINSLTIRWLAEEAANRYAKREYITPVLELETKTGAILALDDHLTLLFPLGSQHSEEVIARITKWNVPSLAKRFEDVCNDSTLTPPDSLCQLLKTCSISLNLANQGLTRKFLTPVIRVLNRESNLVHLDLSGNFFTSDCVQVLKESLLTLGNLERLNLSCTGLTTSHVKILEGLPRGTRYKISDLDLSDNQLDDGCFKSLVELSQLFTLKRLNLSLNRFKTPVGALNLQYLEEFDISDNNLDNNSIAMLVRLLSAEHLTDLKLSRNNMSENIPPDLVFSTFNSFKNLQNLQLSKCNISDYSLQQLLRGTKLKTVDFSYNHLTGLSLRLLLESRINYINVLGCDQITSGSNEIFDDFVCGTFTRKTVKLTARTTDPIFLRTIQVFCEDDVAFELVG